MADANEFAPTLRSDTPNGVPLKLSDRVVTGEVEVHEHQQINVRCRAGTRTWGLPCPSSQGRIGIFHGWEKELIKSPEGKVLN